MTPRSPKGKPNRPKRLDPLEVMDQVLGFKVPRQIAWKLLRDCTGWPDHWSLDDDETPEMALRRELTRIRELLEDGVSIEELSRRGRVQVER